MLGIRASFALVLGCVSLSATFIFFEFFHVCFQVTKEYLAPQYIFYLMNACFFTKRNWIQSLPSYK